jgi:pimeloyl-ACP methyl ester carboxylesterase
MSMIPTAILSVWLSGLLSLGLVGGGAYLARRWYQRSWVYDLDLRRYVFDPDFGWNEPTALLAAAVALLAIAFAGRLLVRGVLALLGATRSGGDPPPAQPRGEPRRLRRPDGSELAVEVLGPADAPPIVLTHGWGANRDEWAYLRRELGDRFRLIAWDLPGLGESKRPADRDYSLEALARHLDAVLELADGRPAVLLGHSIGGMITLTYARLFPDDLGRRVAGLALVHTTYTNPVRTTKHAALHTALERPVLVPLLYLTIALSPLVWLMNWLGYLNGTSHLNTRRSGFAGGAGWDQIDWATRFQLQAPPAVLARGMLGMLAYDATAVLPGIAVPTLVVPGDRDPVCLPEASDRIGREVPAAREAPLSPARHMGLIEHHGRFAEWVAEFAELCARPEPRRRPEGVARG